MKRTSMGLALVVLFAAQIASAQVYYQNPVSTYANLAYTGACVSITRDLSVGSKGTDVLNLQRFIVSRNYPGGGSWMLTSYFGTATRAGVINFQMDMRLPQTGVLDAQTRAALTSVTCLSGQGSIYNPNTNYIQQPWATVPTQSWYNYPNTYPNNPGNYTGTCGTIYSPSTCQCSWYTLNGQNYNTCGNQYNSYSNVPSISNVSGPALLATGTTGTWTVTLNVPNGSNYTSISVNWGETYYGAYTSPQQVYGLGSQTTSFTHAYAQAGTYTITFTASNQYGQSNTITRTVNVTGSSNTGNPYITSISPMTGSVGSVIQISGSGFSGDNTVHFGIGGKMHLTSQSGNYIFFTVPSYLSACDVQTSGYCAQYLQNVTPGQYQIYVTVNGVNSNSLTFTVQ